MCETTSSQQVVRGFLDPYERIENIILQSCCFCIIFCMCFFVWCFSCEILDLFVYFVLSLWKSCKWVWTTAVLSDCPVCGSQHQARHKTANLSQTGGKLRCIFSQWWRKMSLMQHCGSLLIVLFFFVFLFFFYSGGSVAQRKQIYQA